MLLVITLKSSANYKGNPILHQSADESRRINSVMPKIRTSL